VENVSRATLVVSAALSFCAARLAGAQTATNEPAPLNGAISTEAQSGALQEIIVTAQKRSQNLQNVPIAVTAISADSLRASGITDVTQIGALVPGFTASGVGGNFEPRLRGVGSAADGPGVENPVALVVDGIYYANQAFGPASVSDVEQLAVLKGPQGTLFGRNATGGVIQITTRDPTHEFAGEFSTSLDRYLTNANYLYVTGEVSRNIAANLSLSYTYQGLGWGENIATGDSIHRIARDIETRSKWLFTVTDTRAVKLSFDYLNRADNNSLNQRPSPGTVPLFGGFHATSNIWDTDTPSPSFHGTEGGGASVNVDQDLGFAHLVSISAYRQIVDDVFFWPSASSIPLESVYFKEKGKQVSQELQLVSARSDAFNWVAGIYYFHSDESADPVTITLGGPLTPTPTSLGRIDVFSNTTSSSPAAYGQASAQVFPETNLTVGLRYTYERREFSGSELGTLADGTPIGNLPLPAIDPKISFSKPTWRLSLDHNLAADVMAYVSYSRGVKSGGYNGFDPTNPPYGPEQLDDYELGLKSEFFHHSLRLNAAAFDYNYTNIQISKYTTTSDIYNGAAAKLWGFDLDAEASIGDLRLHGGMEWIHPVFSDFPNANISMPLPGGGTAISTGNAKGNELPYTPEFTTNVAVDYTPSALGGAFDFNVTNAYNSGYYTEADNYLRQSAYDLLSSSVTWTAPGDRLSFKLWANNLLNKAVLTYAYTIPPYGYPADYGNPPRIYGGKFTFKF
jgi:iron complex outermembrane receptor protein